MITESLNVFLQTYPIKYFKKYHRLFDYLFLFSGTVLAVLFAALHPTAVVIAKVIYLLTFIALLLFLTYKWNIVSVVAEKASGINIIVSIPISICLGYKNYLFSGVYKLNNLKYISIILDTLSIFAIFILFNFVLVYINCFFNDEGIKHRTWLISNSTLVLSIVALYMFFPYIGTETIDLPATLMTFSYAYGFITRGLLGSIAHLIGNILKTGVTATLIDTFSLVGTVIFVVIVILFFRFVINITYRNLHDKYLCKETSINVILLLLFFSLGFGFSTFYLGMGYFDIYMIILTVISSMLIISNKSLWAIIPLTAICVFIHQGYVFMYFNIVLVLLFYRTFINITSGNFNKKSFVILILSTVVCSVLFVYFQFFSQAKAEYTYDKVYLYAEQILGSNRVYKDIIAQELFGETFDRSEILSKFRIRLLVAIILFSPYIILWVKLWIKVIYNAGCNLRKFIYFVMPSGIVTTLPLWIMHIDYGRWCYAVCFYEIIVILSLIAMKDKHFIKAFNDTAKSIKNKPILLCLLFLYIMYIGAFHGIYMNTYLANIVSWLNSTINLIIYH